MHTVIPTLPILTLESLAQIDDSYRKYRSLFIAYQRQRGKDSFTYDDILLYYAHLKKRGLKANTINTSMACLKKTIRHLMKDETNITKLFYLEMKLKEIPREKIQSKKVDSESDKIPTEAEIKKLLIITLDNLGLFIRFLSHTGCRISELTGIKLGDICEESEFYKITVTGKGNKERKLKVNKGLIDKIKKHFNGQTFLFETSGGKRYRETYITTQIQRLSRRVLGKSFNSHSFRHYFCTTMIRKTGDIKGVSDYVGHSSTAITLDMYTHSIISIKQLDCMLYQ